MSEYDLQTAIMKALRKMDHATPRQRNGPVYQAADILRKAIGFDPMAVGGKPSDGLDDLPGMKTQILASSGSGGER